MSGSRVQAVVLLALCVAEPALAERSVVDMSGGAGISLGLLSDGTAWVWGWANYGCLGDGTTNVTMFDVNTASDRWVPVQPLGAGGAGVLTGLVAIAGGERHQVALDSTGKVWTWGWNIFGQLGNGTTPSSQDAHYTGPYSMGAIPATNGLTGVKAIGTRGYHVVALKNNSEVWAWGYNNYAQCGDRSLADQHRPVKVSGLTGHGGVIDISGGGYTSAALMADHTLMMWGRNDSGQLGNGTADSAGHWMPVAVSQSTGLTNIRSVALSFSHAAALASDGTVWTWGDNGNGALGNGTIGSYTNAPFHVPGLTNIIQVSAGDGATTALKSDGTVWAWGWSTGLGDGTTNRYYAPVQVATGHVFSFVRTINWTTYAIETNGAAWGWGAGFEGQIGSGTNVDALSPVRICWPVLRPSSSGYGDVSPSGPQIVGWGSTNTITITPSNWYHLASLSADGTNVGTPATYTFSNVVADHTIVANFAPDLAPHGTPKRWLAQANPAWTNDFAAAETNDFDHDGMLTWQEYVAGTDPTDSASVFSLNIVPSKGQQLVSFLAKATTARDEGVQRYYSLESCKTPTVSQSWQGVVGWTIIRGWGQEVDYTNLSDSPLMFFRGKVWLGP